MFLVYVFKDIQYVTCFGWYFFVYKGSQLSIGFFTPEPRQHEWDLRCTHLVSPWLASTEKVLAAMAQGAAIVSPQSLQNILKGQGRLDGPFVDVVGSSKETTQMKIDAGRGCIRTRVSDTSQHVFVFVLYQFLVCLPAVWQIVLGFITQNFISGGLVY